VISQVVPNTEEQVQQNAGGEAPSFDYLGILLRRKWIVIIFSLMGLGLGYLYYCQLIPKYQSAAMVHVTSRGTAKIYTSSQNMGSGYDDYMSGYHVSTFVLPTHAVLIKSPLIVGRAIRNKNLVSECPSLAGLENPAAAISAGLTITKGSGRENRDANVLNLTYSGLDSKDCQTILSAVIETYQEYLGETYQNVSQDTVQLITKAKEDLHLQIRELDKRYKDFRSKSPLMWQGHEGTNIYAVRLESIEESRAKAVVQRVEALARREAINNALGEGKSRQALMLMTRRLAKSTMEAGALADEKNDLQSQLLPLQLDEELLLAQYGPDHPRVKEIRLKIQRFQTFQKDRETKKQAEEPSGDFLAVYLDSLTQEAAETRYQEDRLTALFNEVQTEAKKLDDFQVEDKIYKADIDRLSKLFEGVVNRLAEINLIKEYGGYVTQVLSHPGPGIQYEPRIHIALISGFGIGMILGLCLGFLVDLADKSFRSADEIRQQLGLPVVAHIPVLDLERSERMQRIIEGMPRIEPSVVTFHNTKSRESEAYRRVRTALYFNTEGQEHRVIQITSPDPSDGKTTLSTNLSVSIAQSGKRVLLVDADFRRPKIHRVFGVSAETGVSQVITDEIPLSVAIKTTAQPNLDILPCGPRPNNPAELLSSPRFRELLGELRSLYDFVIVDTPPLLAVTDPATVAPCVDGVLVTIRLSKSGRPNAKRAIDQVTAVGGRVIGIVVNGVGGARRYGGYGGKNYSNYYYSYGSRYYRYDETYGYGKYGSYYIDRDADGKPKINSAPPSTVSGATQTPPPVTVSNGANGANGAHGKSPGDAGSNGHGSAPDGAPNGGSGNGTGG
jgi:succinoglycan biosynthesis transport protein ExoP